MKTEETKEIVGFIPFMYCDGKGNEWLCEMPEITCFDPKSRWNDMPIYKVTKIRSSTEDEFIDYHNANPEQFPYWIV